MMSNNIYLGATEGIGFPNLPAPGAGGGSSDAGLIAYEQKTLKADKAYNAGDNFVYDGVIYEATANIAKDADIVIEGAGANAEALDPVQAQINALSGSSGGINYSTSEQNTGLKWIDGKDIYQRTFSFTTTRNGQATTVEDSLITNLDKVVSTDIMFVLSGVAFMANNYYTAGSNYFTAYYNKNSGISYTVINTVDCYFTVRYTKSTT